MMKITSIIIAVLFVGLTIQSCSTSRNLSADLAETYYGFLPCADCPGISYTLKLEKDGQYHLTMDYYDRESVFTTEGKYTYENGRLNLYDDDQITSQLRKDGDLLIYLDADGNDIETELASYYKLYPNDPSRAEIPEESDRDVSVEMYKGTGNEPFWMVRITDDNTIYFKGLMEEELEFHIPITHTSLADDNQSILYIGKDDKISIGVEIVNKPCQDNMAGDHHTTSLEVNLNFNGKMYNLNGCGDFLNKFRLNGIWLLESMNDKSVPGRIIPTLGIYLSDGRIAGSTGCNRFFGSVESFTNQAVRFTQVGSTRMMCPDMSVENQYLQLFNQNDIEWNIDEEGRLHLSSAAGYFVFHRTEEL